MTSERISNRFPALGSSLAVIFLSILFMTVPAAIGDPLASNIAIHFAGWGRGEAGPSSGLPQSKFDVEPTFLTMAEVGEHAFGTLETDMLMRFVTHGAYASDSSDNYGLDHAYFTMNKGFFLLNDGRGGNIDWGLGLDFDWRRADILPREGLPSTASQKMMGGGVVTRLKFDAGTHFMASPSLTYDIYFFPHDSRNWISGHGFRLDCDLWVSAWPGAYTMTLQPFMHWRSWNGSNEGRYYDGAKSRVYGVKMGFGLRPVPFVPQY
jgi:hypothetical protein